PPHPVDDGRRVLHGQSDADVRMAGPEGREEVGREVFCDGQRGTDLDGSGTGFLDGKDPCVEGAVGNDGLPGPLGDALPSDSTLGRSRLAPPQPNLAATFDVAQTRRVLGPTTDKPVTGATTPARFATNY